MVSTTIPCPALTTEAKGIDLSPRVKTRALIRLVLCTWSTATANDHSPKITSGQLREGREGDMRSSWFGVRRRVKTAEYMRR